MNSGGGRIFQLKLDPLTGNSEWVVIDEEDQGSSPQQQPMLATTSYLDMLNDSRRNRAFRQAIDKSITKPCHVLDIGAGTGLLSMMAARAIDPSKSTIYSTSEGAVTACESYLPMVKLMRKVLRLNGMERKVRVINKRSDELEIGVDISKRADILVSEILDSELLGEGLIPTLQHAHDKLLVENPQTVPYRATTYGQVSGTNLFMTAFKRSLGSGDWCDHWKQCVYFVPGKGLWVSQDEELPLHAIHTDISISYEFEIQAFRREVELYDFAQEDQLILLPERVAVYGDSNWRCSMLEAVKKALKGRVCPLCLVPDDSVFLTIALANLCETSHVISLFPGLREKGAKYLRAVASENGYSMDRIEVLDKGKDNLTMGDTHQKKVELLVGEPYYYGNDGMLPWQNLRFW
ncbi:hypothetical protein C3L33_15699, partial [Rhododendron williamsianum]